MKQLYINKWAALRTAIIISNIFFCISFCKQKTNVDWTACLIISVSFSACLFLWLTLNRKNPNMDFYADFSLTHPFFPMNKYPIQFWMLGSQTFMIGGGIALIVNLITRESSAACAGTIFFWGVGIFVSIEVWKHVFAK